jgi:hypothetical protein
MLVEVQINMGESPATLLQTMLFVNVRFLKPGNVAAASYRMIRQRSLTSASTSNLTSSDFRVDRTYRLSG